MAPERYTHVFSADEEGLRLDVALALAFPQFTRSFLKRLIDSDRVLLDGQAQRASIKPRSGQTVEFEVPLVPSEASPEDIPLDIVFEDEHLVVVNKPVGLVVHPAAGNREGTLVNALLFHIDDLSGVGGVERPGIVHRLDKDTSGLLVVAKNDKAHLSLSYQLARRTMTREYLAIAHGIFKQEKGVVDAPIGRHTIKRKEMAVVKNGRRAVTNYTVLEQFNRYAYCSLKLETGRTHQIRVHMSYIGHPLLGDKVYGRTDSFNLPGQMLHAARLGFIHPVSQSALEFEAKPPQRFCEVLDILRQRH